MKKKILWFTGMSGTGKSYYSEYISNNYKSYKINMLDGDIIRGRYDIPVGFTYNDICKNNLTIKDIVKKDYQNYDITIISVISPYENIRNQIKAEFNKDLSFIYMHSDIESLRQRDTKGLYKKADNKEILNLIGYSDIADSRYERPISPDLILNTSFGINPNDNIKKLNKFLKSMLNEI